MTRADILNGNVDLLDKAGEILAGLPVRRLAVTASFTRAGLRVEITATELDRVDVYVEGGPIGSSDVTADPIVLTELRASVGAVVQAKGYLAGELVASRRVVTA
jgi:hypothetical protein